MKLYIDNMQDNILKMMILKLMNVAQYLKAIINNGIDQRNLLLFATGAEGDLYTSLVGLIIIAVFSTYTRNDP